MGTIPFMAPEIWTNIDCNEKFDVYAFAMNIFELLTNKGPFSNCNVFNIVYKVCNKNDRPVFKHEIDAKYKNLIIKCWDKDPEKSPSFAEICLDLENNLITPQVNKVSFLKYKNLLIQKAGNS